MRIRAYNAPARERVYELAGLHQHEDTFLFLPFPALRSVFFYPCAHTDARCRGSDFKDLLSVCPSVRRHFVILQSIFVVVINVAMYSRRNDRKRRVVRARALARTHTHAHSDIHISSKYERHLAHDIRAISNDHNVAGAVIRLRPHSVCGSPTQGGYCLSRLISHGRCSHYI